MDKPTYPDAERVDCAGQDAALDTDLIEGAPVTVGLSSHRDTGRAPRP